MHCGHEWVEPLSGQGKFWRGTALTEELGELTGKELYEEISKAVDRDLEDRMKYIYCIPQGKCKLIYKLLRKNLKYLIKKNEYDSDKGWVFQFQVVAENPSVTFKCVER